MKARNAPTLMRTDSPRENSYLLAMPLIYSSQNKGLGKSRLSRFQIKTLRDPRVRKAPGQPSVSDYDFCNQNPART